MFLVFIAALLVSIGLIQLGALSVWVLVLALALKLVFLVAFLVALYFGLRSQWRRYRANTK